MNNNKVKIYNIDNFVVKELNTGKVLKRYRTFKEEEITENSVLVLQEKDEIYMNVVKIKFQDGEQNNLELGYTYYTTFDDLNNQLLNTKNIKKTKDFIIYFTDTETGDLLELGERISSYNFDSKKEINYCTVSAKEQRKFKFIFENEIKHVITILKIVKIKQLRAIISRIYKIEAEDFDILLNHRFLTKEDDEKILAQFDIDGKELEEIMIFKTIGKKNFLYEILKFNQDLADTPIKDDFDLIQNSEAFFDKEILEKNNIVSYLNVLREKYKKEFSHLLSPELGLAVQLYTTNILYRNINRTLRAGKYKDCLSYLSYFYQAFIRLPVYMGMAYRGIPKKDKNSDHTVGEHVMWMNISSLSLNYKKALEFAQDRVTKIPQVIYEIEVFSARHLDLLSVSDEQEVTLSPYTVLKVVKKREEKGLLIYSMIEVPSPKTPKVLCWIDDNPTNNKKYIEYLEGKGVSCLCMTSTEKMKEFFDHHAWLLSRIDSSNFKIISDMSREEDKGFNKTAGIDTIKLISERKYDSKVLIFTLDKNEALNNCKANNLCESKYVIEESISGMLNYLKENQFLNEKDTYKQFKEYSEYRKKWEVIKNQRVMQKREENMNPKLYQNETKKDSCLIF